MWSYHFLVQVFVADALQGTHNAEAGHSCAGGDGFTATETKPKRGHPGFCKECIIDHKAETIFCCLKCFDENFQNHREHVHIPKRDKVGEIYEDEDDLEFFSSDNTRYRARRIEDHWIPVGDAIQHWVKKLGAKYTSSMFPDATGRTAND